MKEIEQVYSKYCKNQTESLQKIQEYSQPDGPTEIKEFLLVNLIDIESTKRIARKD